MLFVGSACKPRADAQAPLGASAAPATAPAAAPDDLDGMDDRQLVRLLLAQVGAGDLGQQVLDASLAQFRQMPGISQEFIDRFLANARADDLMNLIEPLYLKYYDRATLLAAIRFYRTPAGRQIISTLPSITAESMALGRQWGRTLAETTLQQIQASGGGQAAPAAPR